VQLRGKKGGIGVKWATAFQRPPGRSVSPWKRPVTLHVNGIHENCETAGLNTPRLPFPAGDESGRGRLFGRTQVFSHIYIVPSGFKTSGEIRNWIVRAPRRGPLGRAGSPRV